MMKRVLIVTAVVVASLAFAGIASAAKGGEKVTVCVTSLAGLDTGEFKDLTLGTAELPKGQADKLTDGGNATAGACPDPANNGSDPFFQGPANSYLCYSRWEQDGGAVFSADLIPAMLAGGGWQPYAVAGNVVGGDNIGAYHLVCNLAAGQATTGRLVDFNGYTAYSSVLLGTIGLFQVAA